MLFFIGHQAFPNLEELRVEGKFIATDWQFPEALLCKLKCLDVVLDESTVILSLDFMKILKITGYSSGELIEKVENWTSAAIRGLDICSDLKQNFK